MGERGKFGLVLILNSQYIAPEIFEYTIQYPVNIELNVLVGSKTGLITSFINDSNCLAIVKIYLPNERNMKMCTYIHHKKYYSVSF